MTSKIKRSFQQPGSGRAASVVNFSLVFLVTTLSVCIRNVSAQNLIISFCFFRRGLLQNTRHSPPSIFLVLNTHVSEVWFFPTLAIILKQISFYQQFWFIPISQTFCLNLPTSRYLGREVVMFVWIVWLHRYAMIVWLSVKSPMAVFVPFDRSHLYPEISNEDSPYDPASSSSQCSVWLEDGEQPPEDTRLYHSRTTRAVQYTHGPSTDFSHP